MNCDIIKDLLPLYIDGVSSEGTNMLVETHLAECEDCKKELEQMKDAPTLTVKDEILEKSIKTANKKIKKFKKKTVIKAIALFLSLSVVLGLIYGFNVTFRELKTSFEQHNLLALSRDYLDESVIGNQPENPKKPNVSTIAGNVYVNPSHGEYVLKNNKSTDDYNGADIISASFEFNENKQFHIVDNSFSKEKILSEFPNKKEFTESGCEWWMSLSLVKAGYKAMGLDTTYYPHNDIKNLIGVIEQGQYGYGNGKNTFAKTYATYWTYYTCIGPADEYFICGMEDYDGYGIVDYRKDATRYVIYIQDKEDITKEYVFMFLGFTEEEVNEIYTSFTVNP